MSSTLCPHCGQTHSSEAMFCPVTGNALTPQTTDSQKKESVIRRKKMLFATVSLCVFAMIIILLTTVWRDWTVANAPAPIAQLIATYTPSPTLTPTRYPTSTSSPTATATPTPFITSNLEVIKPLNVVKLQQLAQFADTQEPNLSSIISVSFSRDRQALLTGSTSGKINVYDLKTGKLMLSIKGGDSKIGAVAFSPSRTIVAIGNLDGIINLWSATNGKLIGALKGHTDEILSLSFSPDENFLASGSRDNTQKLWRIKDGALITTYNQGRSVTFVLAGIDVIADSYTSDVLAEQKNLGRCHYFPDGDKNKELLASLAYSPDRKLQVLGTYNWLILCYRWALKTVSPTLSVNFSPDGDLLITGSRDSLLKIWRVSDGNLLTTLKGHTGDINSVDFSSDGRLIASGSQDGTVKIWGIAP